ncbi:hypothetical protein [Sporosarcina ureilytica]|uniref:ABC transporter permease n=1 Tax=Sporosarcina ureilytica TaxID=298596 RepID=A0A1D8JJN6_9BACL|nr:hypothetical protein [Sporosarcina ureilytica]AOV08927.1 hypothetical protein BI350_16145 [Sporosarcina ureilytica]
MLNIIKSDFFRIMKGKLCFYSIVGMVVLGIFFGFIASDDTAFEIAKSGLSNGSLLIPIFLTNILMVVWGHEFSYRVVNNSLILGVKRSTFFMGKTVLTFILTILFVLVYSLSLFTTTFVLSGGFDVVALLKVILAQIPLYLTASALGVLLFNIIKSTYVSVAAFISIAFIGDSFLSNIIGTYLPKFDSILDTLFFTNIRNVTNLSNLSTSFTTTIFVSSIAYTLLALIISYSSFSTREFK